MQRFINPKVSSNFNNISLTMKIIEELITNAGCKLDYLPPYSLDYNSMEYAFSIVKSHFKTQREIIGNETNEELAEKAAKTAKMIVISEMARDQFRRCKINIDS
jgi:hypothetical protein